MRSQEENCKLRNELVPLIMRRYDDLFQRHPDYTQGFIENADLIEKFTQGLFANAVVFTARRSSKVSELDWGRSGLSADQHLQVTRVLHDLLRKSDVDGLRLLVHDEATVIDIALRRFSCALLLREQVAIDGKGWKGYQNNWNVKESSDLDEIKKFAYIGRRDTKGANWMGIVGLGKYLSDEDDAKYTLRLSDAGFIPATAEQALEYVHEVYPKHDEQGWRHDGIEIVAAGSVLPDNQKGTVRYLTLSHRPGEYRGWSVKLVDGKPNDLHLKGGMAKNRFLLCATNRTCWI